MFDMRCLRAAKFDLAVLIDKHIRRSMDKRRVVQASLITNPDVDPVRRSVHCVAQKYYGEYLESMQNF